MNAFGIGTSSRSAKPSVIDAATLSTWKDDPPMINLSSTPLLASIDEELNSKLAIWRGDITRLFIGAIVNAANDHLARGGGICGAIFAAAGPTELVAACKKLKGCRTGSAKLTPGFNLPCQAILHAVGPIYDEYDNETAKRLLACCYTSCLNLVKTNNIRSLAFCCISTGIYGYPKYDAAVVALQTIRSW